MLTLVNEYQSKPDFELFYPQEDYFLDQTNFLTVCLLLGHPYVQKSCKCCFAFVASIMFTDKMWEIRYPELMTMKYSPTKISATDHDAYLHDIG